MGNYTLCPIERQNIIKPIRSHCLISLQTDQFTNICLCKVRKGHEGGLLTQCTKINKLKTQQILLYCRSKICIFCSSPVPRPCSSEGLSLDDATITLESTLESNLPLGPDMTPKQQELMDANTNLMLRWNNELKPFNQEVLIFWSPFNGCTRYFNP